MAGPSNQNQINQVLNDRERCVILHTLDGEILGASPKACHELGYTQEEIGQILLANIKALDLRLSDVCRKHQDDAPIVFQRRNGRRFPAKVESTVTRVVKDREEQNVVRLEFSILADTGQQDSPLPKFDLQESANYLDLLSQEIHGPLYSLGRFLDSLADQEQDDSAHTKLNQARNDHQELVALTQDVADWFKLGTDILHLDRQPFNLVSLCDDITQTLHQKLKDQGCHFSICLDNRLNELGFGDVTRVSQLLHRLLTKALSIHQPNQLRLSISPQQNRDNREVAFSLVVHNYHEDCVEPKPAAPANQDPGLGIIGKLIKIMGGQLKQHRRSDVEHEYFFSLNLPEVDTLDVEANARFLSGQKILLIDNDDSLLKYQLIQWGAEVEFFSAWDKADAYLRQSNDSQSYTIRLLNLSNTQDQDLALASLRQSSGLTLLATHVTECTIDKQGLSTIPLPIKPGLLGNALAVLVNQNLPYPYSQNHKERIVDLGDTRQTVLFVDDVETIRLTFQALLEKTGYKVDLAQNGIDAILACDQKHYDLIIIDIQMPFMDGIEAASHIRNSKNKNTKTPILAISGDISENSRVAIEKVGIQALHPKSAPVEDMVSLTSTIITSRHLPDGMTKNISINDENKLLRAGRRGSENTTTDTGSDEFLNIELLNNLVADTSFDTCGEMVEIFMQESKHSVAVIDEASHQQNWQQVRAEAHAIKSTSYTFGCEALYNIASQLESEIDRGDLQRSAEIVDDMAAIFSRSYLALEDFFRDTKQAPPAL